MRHWKEDLVQLRLINTTTPSSVHVDMNPDVQQCTSSADNLIGPRVAPAAWRPYQEDVPSGPAVSNAQYEHGSVGKMIVQSWNQDKVNKLLNVKEYMIRWPNIPEHELIGSSIQHPFGRNADGTSWRWLVNTTAFMNRCADGSLSVDVDGTYGTNVTCFACATDLSGRTPFMPRYALANDNFIGRVPVALRNASGGQLSSTTLQLLALSRMCVRKVIAEPYRLGDPATKQKGLRANTICFPPAVPKQLLSSSLPASLEARVVFPCLMCL
jgi:hypothetical protein